MDLSHFEVGLVNFSKQGCLSFFVIVDHLHPRPGRGSGGARRGSAGGALGCLEANGLEWQAAALSLLWGLWRVRRSMTIDFSLLVSLE